MKSILSLATIIIGCSIWALSPPTSITTIPETPSGVNWESRIGMNANGAAIITWVKSEQGENRTVLASTQDSGNWSFPQTILHAGKFDDFKPLMDRDGNPYLVVGDFTNARWKYFIASKLGGSWAPATPPEFLEDPQIEKIWDVNFDHRDEVFGVVLFGEKDSESRKLCSYHNQSKRKKNEISRIDELKSRVQILRNPNGKIATLWISPSKAGIGTSAYEFRAAHFKLKKEQWDSPVKVGTINFDSQEKDAFNNFKGVINSAGDIAVIWKQYDQQVSSNYRLRLLYQKYQEPGLISSVSEGIFSEITNKNCSEFEAALDNQGNGVAVWIENSYPKRAVYAALKTKDQNHFVSQHLLSNPYKDASHLDIQHDHQGNFVVVWNESCEEPFERKICGAVWKTTEPQFSPSVTLSSESGFCWYPSLAFSEKGDGLITWTTHVPYSTNYAIQVASIKAD